MLFRSGTVTVPVVVPNTIFETDRIQQVDLRFSKIVQLGHARLTASLDAYNIFNVNNFDYGTTAVTLPNALPGAGEAVGQANRVQPGQAFSSTSAGTFGRFTSTVGRTVGMGTNRQVQLAFRLNF